MFDRPVHSYIGSKYSIDHEFEGLKSLRDYKGSHKILDYKEASIFKVVEAIHVASNCSWKELNFETRVERISIWIEKLVTLSKDFYPVLSKVSGIPINDIESRGIGFVKSYFEKIRKDFDSVKKSYDVQAPLGVLSLFWGAKDLDILPLMSVIPALLAGNRLVVRVNGEGIIWVPLFVESMKEIIEEGAINFIVGEEETVSELLSSHPGIHGVIYLSDLEFLNKTNQNSQIGGPRPFWYFCNPHNSAIILKDADIEKLEEVLFNNLHLDSEKSFFKIHRVLVQKEVFSEVQKRIKSHFQSLNIGAPEVKDTQLAFLDTKESIKSELKKEVSRVGESIIELGNGVFLIENLTFCSPFHQIAPKGQVLLLNSYKYLYEAIKWVNVVEKRFSVSFWTSNFEKVENSIPKLDVSYIGVNNWNPLDLNLKWGPFGNVGNMHWTGTALIDQFCKTKVIN